MKIDAMAGLFPQTDTTRKSSSRDGGASFAEMMANSTSADDLAAKATGPTVEGEEAGGADIETIREKGFRAYVEELQARKMEEMRKEILERMGLSEDDLQAMSAERRAAIEDLIAQEIQRRMEAAAELNDDGPAGALDGTESPRALSGAARTGGAGAALLAVMEQRGTVGGETPDGGNLLPGELEKDS